jgi:hypothetical protein
MSHSNICFFERTNLLQASVLTCGNVPVGLVIEPHSALCEDGIVSRKRQHSQAFEYEEQAKAPRFE